MHDGGDITDQVVQTWRNDGVVVLRGAFDDDWLELLRDGVEHSLNNPSPAARDYAETGKGRFFTDHHMFQRLDQFHRFLYESPVAAIAARLMGSTKLNLIDEHLLVKEPSTENPTFWHHDLPYYEVAGRDFCSIWTPLDPVTEATGAMKFVKGSHSWGKLFHPVRIAQGALVDEAEALDGPAPDIDAEPDKYDIELFEMEPGDCIAFHGTTLHSATPNSSSDRRRRALSLRFAGDDITWNPRPFRSSGPGRPDLNAGDPIDSDQYPQIWTGREQS
jgi:ectoine hydroxylase-related dioxygenase (phytanoyl-CoA dioxygenase family)